MPKSKAAPHAAAVRPLTVTIAAKGALDPVVVRIDEGTPREQGLLMVPSDDRTTWVGHGVAHAGDHWLTWFLRGRAGTAYTIRFDGPDGGPWTPDPLETIPPGRDDGYVDFTVGAV